MKKTCGPETTGSAGGRRAKRTVVGVKESARCNPVDDQNDHVHDAHTSGGGPARAQFSRKVPYNYPTHLFAAVGINQHNPSLLCFDVDETRLIWIVQKCGVRDFQGAVIMQVENTMTLWQMKAHNA